ncbi:MAG: protease pro-enzyme activation domain-containing protein [Acidimicrobiales bacterium]
MKRLTRWVLASVVVISIAAAVPRGSADASAPKRKVQAFVRPDQLRPNAVSKSWRRVGTTRPSQILRLSVVLPPSNTQGLHELLADLYNPKSPNFHHWLAKGQFDQRFAPSRKTVSAVESWLHGRGFGSESQSGFAIDFSGPVAKVSRAFGLSIHNYRSTSGALAYSADEAPLVPSGIGSQITAVLGLQTLDAFAPENQIIQPQKRVESHDVVSNADGLTACPAAEAEAGSDYYTLDVLGEAYGIGSLLNYGLNGHGKTIGLYELASHSASDVSTYMTCFDLTNSVSTVPVLGGGGGVGTGTPEADVDIEQAMTQAPGAAIISYEGPNSGDGPYETWYTIVHDDAAQVVSTSWGACEPDAESAGWISAFSTLFSQAASQGQTILAATGDSGSEDCFRDGGGTAEQQQVDYPASDPNVTAVGGTSLFGSGDEPVWNFCASGESVSCANSNNGQAAGGGGMSRHESRPSYEPNLLTWTASQPCGVTCRELPDISTNAGVGMVTYVNGNWDVGGGTSLAAPFVAGLVADRDTGCASNTGLWTPDLYALAAQGAYGTAFNDITSGNNDMTGSTGANFTAGTGYDAASGIGSPIATGLTCSDVASVYPASATPGTQVTISGLGLEHATILFGGVSAQIVSESATGATVVVPNGYGSVNVSAISSIGNGSIGAQFTYEGSSDESGYDLVGSDGGVFVLSPDGRGFYGSLPGIHVKVDDIKGMVPSSNYEGYYLVGSDGGVFAFGDADFANSLPGLHDHVDDIVGIVPTSDDKGYFLVGSDGGVFAFGDAPFLGSLPGEGIHTNDIIAIAATPSDQGYWVVAANGKVYAFGDAKNLGSATGSSSPVSGIASTPNGGGYWIVTRDGGVYAFGDATNYGSLPGLKVTPSKPIIGLVPTESDNGYWLIGSDGGVFAFGQAPYVGSLPALHVSVSDIVGAVPTET